MVAADFAIGLKDKYAGAEKTSLYLGAKGTYQVSDELSVALPVKFGTVFDVDDSWGLEVAPSVTYKVDAHSFSVGATIDLAKEYYAFKFPVSWTYSFK